MKKLLLIFMLFTIPLLAQTQSLGEASYFTKNLWKLAGTVVSPANTAWTLTLPATTFSPSIVTPLIIGGADTISTLTYKTTTGVGKTGARHIFVVGNNGATEAMTILNSGNVGIGIASPASRLTVQGTSGNLIDLLNGGATKFQVSAAGTIYFNSGTATISTTGGAYFGGSVGIGTATPYAQYSQVGALPIWYATDSDVNLSRTTLATATDTSAIKIDASVAQPIITFKNTTGNGFVLQSVAAGGASFDGGLTIAGKLTQANQSAIAGTITSDYSVIYPYDDGSNVKVMALLDDAGTETTTQVATANMWGEPQEGVIFDGTNDYVNVSTVAATQNFTQKSLEFYFKPTGTNSDTYLYDGGYFHGTYGSIFALTTSTNLAVKFRNTAGTVVTVANITYASGTKYHIIASYDGVNVRTYVNGALHTTTAVTGTIGNSIKYSIGATAHASTNYLVGEVYTGRIYNFALTQAEVTQLYNNGQPHLAKVPYKYRWGSQTMVATYDSSQASSDAFTLEMGKSYNWVKGSADSLVSNSVKYTASTKFVAGATSGTAYGDLTGSTLKPAGAVASYKGTNAGATGWIDESDNRLHGNTSGSPVALSGHRDVKDGATAAIVFTASAKKGTILKYVKIVNNVADADSVTMGTVATETQVFTQQIIGSLGTVIVVVDKFFSDSAAQTLYLDSANWTNDNLDVILYYEPLSKEL